MTKSKEKPKILASTVAEHIYKEIDSLSTEFDIDYGDIVSALSRVSHRVTSIWIMKEPMSSEGYHDYAYSEWIRKGRVK